MMSKIITFREVLDDTEQTLIDAGIWCGHGYESEYDEAVALILAAASLPESTGDILDHPVSKHTLEKLEKFLQARIEAREPTAYIIGHAWLGPLKFTADPRALVPRSPLMELIHDCFEPWWQGDALGTIVDVCCGGGSLGLLAAAQFPEATVELLDIDNSAVNLARENLVLHELSNAAIIQANLLTALADSSVDIILANPPYVNAEDMASLPPEYLHEPQLALAAGVDGLQLIHQLIVQAANILQPEGVMFLEVGNSWAALEEAYPNFIFMWLEFENGGHGVCVLTQAELQLLRAQAKNYISLTSAI